MEKFFRKSEKGMTLMEMLVAIGILTMGMAGFTVLFVKSWQANSFIIEEGQAAVQATETVNKIARQLRGIRQSETATYMIEAATDTDLVVFANDDDDDEAERIHFYLDDDNNQLIKGVAQFTGSYPAPGNYASDEETVLAEYVMNESGSDPIFVYRDHENSELTAPIALNQIRVIEINLWINIKPLTAPENVKIGTSVELRNLDAS